MHDNAGMVRVQFEELTRTLESALEALGVTGDRAKLSARMIAETDADGVSTHGVARFPRFAEMVRLGRIDAKATPECTMSVGAFERWSGARGPGNLAAYAAMTRAMELASSNGMGAVALGETTHWQRGGTYGWQAAEAGFAAMCWSNTLANLPPWGATSPAVGNNPLVIAVPGDGADGEKSGPVVLDMAMSQFSYGTLTKYRERGEALPVPGGYDAEGNLTTDAAKIEATQRALPVGYWKGSGLAFVLDVLGALLAAGNATHQIPQDALREVGQSQIFLAFAPEVLQSGSGGTRSLLRDAIAALHGATPEDGGQPPRFPGERVLETRRESMKAGVAVPEEPWRIVQGIARKTDGYLT